MNSKLGVVLKNTSSPQYTPSVNEGLLYVKNDTPTTLHYVDSSGTDNTIGYNTVLNPERLVFQINTSANQTIAPGETKSTFLNTTIVENVGGYFSSPATNLQMTFPSDQTWLFSFAFNIGAAQAGQMFEIIRSGGTSTTIENSWGYFGGFGVTFSYIDKITAGGPYTISIKSGNNATMGTIVLKAFRLF
jgi:hypothetical protein